MIKTYCRVGADSPHLQYLSTDVKGYCEFPTSRDKRLCIPIIWRPMILGSALLVVMCVSCWSCRLRRLKSREAINGLADPWLCRCMPESSVWRQKKGPRSRRGPVLEKCPHFLLSSLPIVSDVNMSNEHHRYLFVHVRLPKRGCEWFVIFWEISLVEYTCSITPSLMEGHAREFTDDCSPHMESLRGTVVVCTNWATIF